MFCDYNFYITKKNYLNYYIVILKNILFYIKFIIEIIINIFNLSD